MHFLYTIQFCCFYKLVCVSLHQALLSLNRTISVWFEEWYFSQRMIFLIAALKFLYNSTHIPLNVLLFCVIISEQFPLFSTDLHIWYHWMISCLHVSSNLLFFHSSINMLNGLPFLNRSTGTHMIHTCISLNDLPFFEQFYTPMPWPQYPHQHHISAMTSLI